MNLPSRAPKIRTQTGIILLLCLVVISIVSFWQQGKNHSHLHNLACRATIEIVRDTASFRGIIDIKSGDSKGIVNIDGIIKDANNSEQTVQRMVLFTHSSYGSSPVWVSQNHPYIKSRNRPCQYHPATPARFLPDQYQRL